jgi:hypothetical protein
MGGFGDASPSREDGSVVPAWLRTGMLAKPGTYRLRPGESLVYFRGRDGAGDLREGKITVERVR